MEHSKSACVSIVISAIMLFFAFIGSLFLLGVAIGGNSAICSPFAPLPLAVFPLLSAILLLVTVLKDTVMHKRELRLAGFILAFLVLLGIPLGIFGHLCMLLA